MAKWFGKIGYSITQENPIGSGIWKESIVEKEYYGELDRNFHNSRNSNGINDNLVLSNQISIISDPFAIRNSCNIRYVTYMGEKWRVSSVEVLAYPRLRLTLEEVYNG